MQAFRVRGLFLVVVFLSWSVHAQVAAPTDGPPSGSDVIPSDSALPPAPSDAPRVAGEQYDEQAIGFDDFGALVVTDGAVTVHEELLRLRISRRRARPLPRRASCPERSARPRRG